MFFNALPIDFVWGGFAAGYMAATLEKSLFLDLTPDNALNPERRLFYIPQVAEKRNLTSNPFIFGYLSI